MTENKRKSTRHTVSLPVTLSVDGQDFAQEICNLSLGGALITTPHRLDMGAVVHLSFRIPTLETQIDIEAEVRWTGDNGAGLQFGGLRAKEVWSLNKYFEDLES